MCVPPQQSWAVHVRREVPLPLEAAGWALLCVYQREGVIVGQSHPARMKDPWGL